MKKKENTLKLILLSVIFTVTITTAGVVFFAVNSSGEVMRRQHQVEVVTRQKISLVQDSLINEIRTLNQVNMSLKSAVKDAIQQNNQLRKEHEKHLDFKNKIIRDLTHSVSNLSDSIKTVKRSELENRYNYESGGP